MANTVDKVINIALAEEGYLEKASNKNLDDKLKNVGASNFTKYGRDMHNIYPSVMDFPAAWCDCFVDWCFYKAYGVANAKSLLGGNFDDYTIASAQLYKNKGAWYTSNPKIGDQIFFKNNKGTICHTGLVYKVDGSYVYTIEGNTSSAAGVVANGGCVRRKSYALNYSKIAGYGRPKYDSGNTTVINNNTQNVQKVAENTFATRVMELQRALNAEYGKKLAVDGIPGPKTLAATPTLNKKTRGKKPQTVKALQNFLSYYGYKTAADGDFYVATEKMVKNFQKSNVGYKNPDGEFTAKGLSWKRLLKLG